MKRPLTRICISLLFAALVIGNMSCKGSNNNKFFGESVISGKITTTDGAGLTGATISVSRHYGTDTGISDADGNFRVQVNDLAALDAGSVTIQPAMAGYDFSPSQRTVVFSGTASGQDFTATRIHTVSGTVATAEGATVAGVTLIVSQGSSTEGTSRTDAGGAYAVDGLLNGTYIITPSCSSGCTFTPESTTVTVADSNVEGVNFVINETMAPVTGDAAGISDVSSYLSGSYTNPFGSEAKVWFDYGTTVAYSSKGGGFTDWSGAGSGSHIGQISGLQQLTTYHYRLAVQVEELTFYSQDKTFTTLISPETIASGLDWPIALAIDATTVYIIDNGSGVKKVAKNGGTVTTLASIWTVRTIAVDSANVYWVEDCVKKVGINGGDITTLTSAYANSSALAIDSSNVYWEYAGINKVSKNGGSTTNIASGTAYAMAVDATSVYWADGSAINKVGIDGGTVTTLASAGEVRSLAVDAESAYFGDAGYIKKVGINGGTVTTLTTEPTYVYNVVVDSSYAYWIGIQVLSENNSIMSLMKVSINGGPTTVLASGLGGSSFYLGLAVDATHVYWTEQDNGVVKRVPKGN